MKKRINPKVEAMKKRSLIIESERKNSHTTKYSLFEQEGNKVLLGESIKPEDRVTDSNCISDGTTGIVKTNYDFAIKYGYKCLGKEVKIPSSNQDGDQMDPYINIILKKVPENGNEYYIFIKEVPFMGNEGDLSYYFIKKDKTKGEGKLNNIDELPSVEQK